MDWASQWGQSYSSQYLDWVTEHACTHTAASEIPQTEEPGGLQSMEPKRARQDLVTKQQQMITKALIWSQIQRASSVECQVSKWWSVEFRDPTRWSTERKIYEDEIFTMEWKYSSSCCLFCSLPDQAVTQVIFPSLFWSAGPKGHPLVL